MKTALRSRLRCDNWLDKLPWTMLGVRMAPKEDLDMSTAELVYGAPLTVPGEFLGTPTEQWSPDNLRSKLTDTAERFAPVPTSRHCQPSTRVPKDLSTSRYVFIRHDGYRGPLKRPYDAHTKLSQLEINRLKFRSAMKLLCSSLRAEAAHVYTVPLRDQPVRPDQR